MPSRGCTYYIASTFVTVKFLVAFVVFNVNSVLAIVASEGVLIGHDSLWSVRARWSRVLVNWDAVWGSTARAWASGVVRWLLFRVWIGRWFIICVLANHQILSNFSSVCVGWWFFVLILSVAGEFVFVACNRVIIITWSNRSLTTCWLLVSAVSSVLRIVSWLPLRVSQVPRISWISSGMFSSRLGISELSDVTSVGHWVLLQACFVLRIATSSLWSGLFEAFIVLFPDRSLTYVFLLARSTSTNLVGASVVWFVSSTALGSIRAAAYLLCMLVRGTAMLPWLRVPSIGLVTATSMNRLGIWPIVIVWSNTSLFIHFINI